MYDRCFSCSHGYYLQKVSENDVYGQCLACSDSCLTCIDESTKCNSCDVDKVLIGFGCVTAQNIIFKITLKHHSITEQNSEEIAFIKEVVAFTKNLAKIFGYPYSSNPELLYIKDISSGSIQVTYMASISNMDPRILLKSITSTLSEFEGYGSFTVLQTEIVAHGFQTDTTIEPPDSYLYISLVPSPFFIVILIVLVHTCCRVKQVI